jgi:endonuclease I/V8-like Glu-specific endopeptidase
MTIPISLLHETARRYDERKSLQDSRQSDLKKVQWKANMNAMDRIRLLKQIDSPERVEKRLKRLSGEALQYLQTAPESVSGMLTQDAQSFNEVFFERILGQKDLMNINFLEKGSVVARSVGKIVLKNSMGGSIGYGTGFLISPRLVMTNNHVFKDSRDARYSHIEFDNQLDLTGNLLKSTIYTLNPDSFFLTNKALDVSIVALNGSGMQHTIGWNKLIEEEGKIVIGEYMNIIQHPDGRPKELSFRANQLMDVLPSFLHYETDTEPGSSGSPVFNDQWEVVGLHHSGVPKTNAEGKILNKNNQEWVPSMGEAQIQWLANEGIRISSILKYLKSVSLQGDQKKYRNEIFELEPPKYQLCYLNDDQYKRIFEAAPVSSEGKPATEEGTFTYHLPIQIKIQVGEKKEVSGVSVGDKRTPTDPDSKKPATFNPKSDGVGFAKGKNNMERNPFEKERQEALRELEVAKTKDYFNEAEDKQHKTAYYKGIKANSLDPTAFYAALSRLLQATHENELPYRPAKHLYTWVDLQPNYMLRSIYSGKEYNPEQIIDEDFQNEMRLLEFSDSLMQEVGLTDQQMAEKIALFEAGLPYNCEHVVPQSWFGKLEPMRGDLHHLFTCESGCNSFRGNIPYFDFDDFEEAVRDECGKRDGNQFEPGNGKGEVARATLYFLLRYPEEINAVLKEYTKDRIALLLDWHQNHKVTEHERHRNAAIYSRQGNRNPLIDFPAWASKINFLKGLGK